MAISWVNLITRPAPPLLGRVWDKLIGYGTGMRKFCETRIRFRAGMFNALSGMGEGGQVDATAANNANTALYTTFAIFDVLGGGIYNILDPHFTLFAGCLTYVLYADSFLYYNHYQHQGFAIVVGAILGIGVGLLWAGQGAIMTSYPPPGRKGSYISLFWSIFNMGGVIGRLIPFILNYNRSEATFVNDDTYIGFMCFMFADIVLMLAILHLSYVVRDDDNHYTNIKYSDVSTETVEILKLFRNWKMLLMVSADPAPPRKHIWYGDGIPLTRLALGMGRGWERDLSNWDENGVRVAPPKPTPLPILTLTLNLISSN
ncbi:UNC93-like protein 1 [Vitis riparia]|uniref:UNC93-like protein 1 n=1 Tax=Vitis riparia TaxID=96939 RepID=UPI00155AED78|nr:UNC93-like protein 1 [Vitis riparia]